MQRLERAHKRTNMNQKSHKNLMLFFFLQLGFGKLFRSTNKLYGINQSGKPMHANFIGHQAQFIANGTVTDSNNVFRNCANDTIPFIVNRPFIFYVIDMTNRIPYFSGLVIDVNEKNPTSVIDRHKYENETYKNHINCNQL